VAGRLGDRAAPALRVGMGKVIVSPCAIMNFS